MKLNMDYKAGISVIILTKNEEKNILDCIETILWADEIIILDDNSEDRTIEVVKSLSSKKIKIFKRQLNDDFSAQRNFGLYKAKYEWVLFVDADERLSSDLREEINTILIRGKNNFKYDGFNIPRKDIIWGKLLKHGETGNIKLLRFGRKDAGQWQGKVHEEWKIKGNISELDNYLTHYPHPTISEFLNEINFYTTIRAKELFETGVKSSIKDIILYTKGKFLLNYIFKLGFLDGIEGLIFAFLMSFHSFLVRSKLWLLWKKQ